jgi:hypothetical protein
MILAHRREQSGDRLLPDQRHRGIRQDERPGRDQSQREGAHREHAHRARLPGRRRHHGQIGRGGQVDDLRLFPSPARWYARRFQRDDLVLAFVDQAHGRPSRDDCRVGRDDGGVGGANGSLGRAGGDVGRRLLPRAPPGRAEHP